MEELDIYDYYITELEKQLEPILKDYDFPGVYAISVNDKVVYVGKSRNLKRRLFQHCFNIKYYDNPNIASDKLQLYRLLNYIKFLGYHIHFEVLFKAAVEPTTPLDWIDFRIGIQEAFYIRYYKPCLNINIPYLLDYYKCVVNPKAETITKDEFFNYISNNKPLIKNNEFWNNYSFYLYKKNKEKIYNF